MLDAIDADLASIDGVTEQVYLRCRDSDYRLSLVQRIYEWYAGKYDQRADDRLAPILRAADEVVRSCWAEPFVTVGRTPPTGPLVYLESRFDAFATPRVSVPPDLRAPNDAVIGECVRELPIPVIALPALSVDEPWWLVLAAHETGHHVQRDLDASYQQAARDVLLTATARPPGNPDLAGFWYGWALETFADAFAVLMVGTAAAWAVEELQFGPATTLVFEPAAGDRYPPPAVRTALLGELARLVGIADPGPGATDVAAWLDSVPEKQVSPGCRSAVAAHLAVTPAAARALIELSVDGVSLRELCAWTPDLFAPDGLSDRWARSLVAAAPVITGRSARVAARAGIAGGVAAHRARDGERLDRLRVNLPIQLAECGPTGHLAALPATGAGLDTVAARLTKLVLDARPEGARA